MSLVTKLNELGIFYTNYTIGLEDDNRCPESLFAKWVIKNYSENELHEWIMFLLSNTIDIGDMEGTFRSQV